MVVVGIMGIVLTMGVPIVYKVFHRPPMAQAIKDVFEVCSRARAQAILRGQDVDLVCHPQERRFEVVAAAPPPSPAPGPTGDVGPASPPAPTGSGSSAQLSDHIIIDMLDVNLTEYKDAESARVRFYPNGTCDEFTLILHSDKGEQRGIVLEITTGLASVLNENDLQNLRNGRL